MSDNRDALTALGLPTSVTSSKSFYVAGGTLSPDAPSYLARAADGELLDALTRGDLCYVLNARQLGKSSLCLRTRQALTARGVRTAFLDLQKFGASATPEQWYNSLLQRIGLDLKLRADLLAYWRDNADRAPLDRLFGAIAEVALARDPSPLVLFLDEVDVVRSLPFSTDEFFGAIREIYNERATNPDLQRLTFCLVGSALQADLVTDTRLSPFNVGRQLDLRDFTRDELAPLAPTLGANRTALIARVHHWTGGHPFLTQSLCAAVVAAGASTTDAVDKIVAETYFTRTARRDIVHLADVSNRMLSRKAGEIDPADDRQKADILALYEQIWRARKPVMDDARNPLVGLLKLSGIVRAESGVLKVRNRLYETVFDAAWIAENRPDAEVRRQRAAVARARWQIGSIAAAVLLLMAGLLWRTSKAEQRANAQTRKALDAASRESAEKSQAEAQARRAESARRGESSAKSLAQANARKAQVFAVKAASAATHADQEAQAAKQQAAVATQQTTLARQQTAIATQQTAAANHLTYLSTISLAAQNMDNRNYRVAQQFLADAERFPKSERSFEWELLQARFHPELRLMRGHTDVVNAVAFSPDGRRVVSGSSDGTARVWDAATGRQQVCFRGHKDEVDCVAFSPDGSRIVSGSQDHTARIWDARTGQQLVVLQGTPVGVRTVRFSRDGATVISAAQNVTTHIWDAHTGRELLVLDGRPEGVSDAVVVVDPTTHQRHITLTARVPGVAPVSFNLIDRKVVSGDWDKLVYHPSIMTTEYGKGHTYDRVCAAFTPDGTRLAAVDILNVDIRDTRTEMQTVSLEGHTDSIQANVFSPDGKKVATASNDGTACIWDATNGKELLSLNGHINAVNAVTFSPDGARIVTASADKTVRVWDAKANRELLTLDRDKAKRSDVAYDFSSDRSRLVTSGKGYTSHIWDPKTGKLLLTLRWPKSWVTSALYSPDGREIATCNADATVCLWNATTGTHLATLPGPANTSVTVSFSPDSRLVFTGNSDGTSYLWDAATGAPKRMLDHAGIPIRGGYSINGSFSRDSKRLLTWQSNAWLSSGTQIHAWDVATGKCTNTFGNVSIDAAFSPDGRRAVTGTANGQVYVWDTQSGAKLLDLKGHTNQIDSVAYSLDGKRIVTSSADSSVRVWDAATGRELLLLKRPRDTYYLGTSFTPDGKGLIISDSNVTVLWGPASEAHFALSARQQATIDKIIAPEESEAMALDTLSFDPLSVGLVESRSYATRFPDLKGRLAEKMNDAAWKVVDPTKPRPAKETAQTAREIAELAVQYAPSQDSSYLNTLAAAQFVCGDLQHGLANERKAVQCLPADSASAGYKAAQSGIINVLRSAAWDVVDPIKPRPAPETAKEALKIASFAVALTKGQDWASMDILAGAQFADGDIKGAIQTAQKAAGLASGTKAKNNLSAVGNLLNGIAWLTVDPAKPQPTPAAAKQALRAATLAVEYTKGQDGLIVDTLAAAQFACGDLQGALATERKAVALLPKDKDLAASLKRYETLSVGK